MMNKLHSRLALLQLTELLKFLLILMVFIISFGVAFQAILHPNQQPSWATVVDIVWRPYWQMFGELFLEDSTGGMGESMAISRGQHIHAPLFRN